MKAQELMIGDWVIEKDRVCRVSFNTTIEEVRKEDCATSASSSTRYYDIEPIPLTPEVLEKNGFNKPQDAGDGTLICGITIGPYKLTFQSVFGLPILTIENVVDNDNNHTCLVIKDEIYNVHELQHALRLCGIEKEIVL